MIKTNLFTTLLAICLLMVSCSKEQKLENQAQPTYEMKELTAQVCDGGDEKDDDEPLPMLQGQVSDNQGLPVYQACVDVWTIDGMHIGGTGTDANGNYWFNTLPAGEFIVKAHKFDAESEGYVVIDSEPETLNMVLN